MGIQPSELAVQRLLTAEFIKADVQEIVLYRAERQEDGAGGYLEGEPAPLPPQDMRIIPLGDGAQQRFTADGQEVTPSYMLMGAHDADMERWDYFEAEGRRYQVVFINANRQYETKGEVAYHG